VDELVLERGNVVEFGVERDLLVVEEVFFDQTFLVLVRNPVYPFERYFGLLLFQSQYDNEILEYVGVDELEVVDGLLQFVEQQHNDQWPLVRPLSLECLHLVTVQILAHFSDEVSFFERKSLHLAF